VKDHYRIVLISENKIYIGDGDLEIKTEKMRMSVVPFFFLVLYSPHLINKK
jgi:hypothetical protein